MGSEPNPVTPRQRLLDGRGNHYVLPHVLTAVVNNEDNSKPKMGRNRHERRAIAKQTRVFLRAAKKAGLIKVVK